MAKKKSKKTEIVVNLKVPREWNEVRKKLKLKWFDTIRLGLSVGQEEFKKLGLDKKKPKPPVDPYQTPAEKRQHMEAGPMQIEVRVPGREYHVFNRIERMWVEKAFDDIAEGEVFRMVEDGQVLKTGGHKYLAYIGFSFRNDAGKIVANVQGRRRPS